MNFKILIIEDEYKIVEAVESYLNRENYNVCKAYKGLEGLEIFYSEKPDLVILDLMLPDITGENICREIRKTSDIPIIMLTAKSNEESMLMGLNIGADDYITKPFSPRELVARVNVLLRRYKNKFSDKVILNSGKLEINFAEKVVKKDGENSQLTPTEFKLIETFIKSPSRIFTRDELITIVLGYNSFSSDRTVDAHIKNLRSKIEIDPKNPKLIITVFGIGYKFGGYSDENKS